MACKYFVIKLISRAPGSSSYDANMDMFPLEFHGYKLPIPKIEGSSEPILEDIQEDNYDNFNLMNTLGEIELLTGAAVSEDTRPI